jgi:hypothetical protein
MWQDIDQGAFKRYIFFNIAKRNILLGVVDTCASSNVLVVTDAIVDAVTSLNPKIRYVLGWDANLIWLFLSRLPSGIGDFLKRHISKIEIPEKLQGLQ